MRSYLLLLLVPFALMQLPAAEVSLKFGYGGMTSLSGSVLETDLGGALLDDGVNLDIEDLGLDEDVSSILWDASVRWRWFELLLQGRHSELESSGTAEREFRLDVSSSGLGLVGLNYLTIPTNTAYNIDASTNFIGVGGRITPFHFGEESRLAFTPWLFLGVQYLDADASVDAGSVIRIETSGITGREISVGGRASASGTALIPEYGIGGELRWKFHDGSSIGPELILDATLKLLDFQGALDFAGVESDQFDDLDIDYTALQANLTFQWPVGQQFLGQIGVYMEQVDAMVTLDADQAEQFQRDIEVEYLLLGAMMGIKF